MQVNLALASFMPNLLLECANLARFLTPAINTAAQVSAYDVIVQTLSPALPVHKVETARHVDRLLVPYLSLVSQADESAEAVYAETRALMLRGEVEARRLVVAAAPHGEAAASRPDTSAPAGQRIVKALQDLCAEPQSPLKLLERSLLEVWNEYERRPID